MGFEKILVVLLVVLYTLQLAKRIIVKRNKMNFRSVIPSKKYKMELLYSLSEFGNIRKRFRKRGDEFEKDYRKRLKINCTK